MRIQAAFLVLCEAAACPGATPHQDPIGTLLHADGIRAKETFAYFWLAIVKMKE
jgi:hypothetical protein